MSTRRTWTAAGVGVLTVALVAMVVSLSFLVGSTHRAAAIATVDPDLDFLINSTTGGQNCDSSGTPTATCTFPLNSAFTMNFSLHSLGSATTWQAYDLLVAVQNLTVVEASLAQTVAQDPGVWPDCAIPVADFSNPRNTDPPQLIASCSEGIGATPSTYTGLLMRLDFQCGASNAEGSLTLLPQGLFDDGTHLLVDYADQRIEDTGESLTIICGTLPTPTATATRTPGGPTDTPSPTSTETPTATSTPSALPATSTATPTDTPALPTTPPTATRTPTRTPPPAQRTGDVNGDERVDTLDALWVLWLGAGMVPSVAHPENADLNHDSLIDARDAAIILQIEAGLVTLQA